MVWFVGFIIICVGYLAIAHGFSIVENHQLRAQIEEQEGSQPQRLIFIRNRDSTYMNKLIKMGVDAHNRMDILPKSTISEQGRLRIFFENRDEILALDFDYQPDKLSKKQILEYNNKIFIDYKVDANKAVEIIGALGLHNYMVEIGFVDKNSLKE